MFFKARITEKISEINYQMILLSYSGTAVLNNTKIISKATASASSNILIVDFYCCIL